MTYGRTLVWRFRILGRGKQLRTPHWTDITDPCSDAYGLPTHSESLLGGVRIKRWHIIHCFGVPVLLRPRLTVNLLNGKDLKANGLLIELAGWCLSYTKVRNIDTNLVDQQEGTVFT